VDPSQDLLKYLSQSSTFLLASKKSFVDVLLLKYSSPLSLKTMKSMPTAAPPPLYTQYYPRAYVAPYLAAPLSMTIDGNLSKLEWQQAQHNNVTPWSDLFDDIRGADNS
jgi:hypothetical protein